MCHAERLNKDDELMECDNWARIVDKRDDCQYARFTTENVRKVE